MGGRKIKGQWVFLCGSYLASSIKGKREEGRAMEEGGKKGRMGGRKIKEGQGKHRTRSSGGH